LVYATEVGNSALRLPQCSLGLGEDSKPGCGALTLEFSAALS